MGHVYPYWQIMLTKLPDYYFSFMKLIVSTFLVYKVKKCLLKSGKVIFLQESPCFFLLVKDI